MRTLAQPPLLMVAGGVRSAIRSTDCRVSASIRRRETRDTAKLDVEIADRGSDNTALE